MTTMTNYDAVILNQSGYVVLTPNLGEGQDRLQSYPPNPYAESASQLFPLGTKMIQGERVWRYCKNAGTALDIAAPLQSTAAIHAEMNYNIVCVSGALAGTDVVLTSTANLDTGALAVANGIAEGYLYINDEAGEGQGYKIKSHDALVTTGNATFKLYDPLTIALTTNSQIGLVQNPYANVLATIAVATGMCVGVPLLAVTENYYFWSQTGGPAPVAANGTMVLGTSAVIGTTAALADPGSAATTEVIIGYPLTPCSTASETFMCFLTLDR